MLYFGGMAPSRVESTQATVELGRRTPVQRRSIERVQRILTAAETVVVERGVEALTTTAVAAEAAVPVASLYQYFADRDAIIGALIERHVRAMDDQLAAALAALQSFSLRSLTETTVAAYVAGYRERPSYVILWFQGRVSGDLQRLVRRRTEDLANRFHAFAVAAGLIEPDTDPLVVRLVGEMIDAFLAVAYRDDVGGDSRVIREGTEMIVSYLERFATATGIDGISVAELAVQLEIGTTPG
jgi:AcrR family transcriptional regulator